MKKKKNSFFFVLAYNNGFKCFKMHYKSNLKKIALATAEPLNLKLDVEYDGAP